jgi:putative ABC transport system permease protein
VIFDALVGGYVRRYAWRALTSILAIALGVAVALSLAMANAQTIRELGSDRELFAPGVDFQVVPFGNRLPQATLPRVRYLDGVATADPIIDRPITIGVNAAGSGGDAARLVGADLLQPLPGIAGFDDGRPGPFARSGSFIDPALVLGSDGAIVSSATAQRLGLRRGSSFNVLLGARVVALRVANVLPANATGADSNTVFVDIGTAQAMVGALGAFDRIDVIAGGSPDAVRTSLVAAIGGRARVVVPASRDDSLGSLTTGIEATFGALASIGLAVGGLLVYNAVGTSIALRRGDIGTLLALGVEPASIVSTFVGEGAAYGALGGFLGAALAVFALQIVARVTGAQARFAAYDVWVVAPAVLLGVGVAVLASIAPALAATRVAPALTARQGSFNPVRESMPTLVVRAFAGAGAFALGIGLASHPSGSPFFVFGFPLCFASGTVLLIAPVWRGIGAAVRAATSGAPPSLRLAGVTLTATPQRIGVALAALALAVFAAVAFDAASNSFATALHAWAREGIAGDIIVRPAGIGGEFDAGVPARVRAIPGVVSVIAMRTIATQAGSLSVNVRGEDGMTGATLGAPLAATLHVKAGGDVVVRAALGNLRVRIAAARPDFSDATGTIVVGRDVLRAAFGDTGIDALRLEIDKSASPTRIENAIASRLAPRRIAMVDTKELRARFTSVFDGTFALVRILATLVVTIAAFGAASAFAAFVLERRFELQALRTIGASRATIAGMLAIEALVIALTGSALGVVIGMGFAAVQLYVSDPIAIGFAIPLNVPVPAVAAVLAGAIVVSMLAPLLTAPAAFRIATDRKP